MYLLYQSRMSSVVRVLFAKGRVEGRRVADCGGLVRSIFHGRVLTVSERTSFRDCTTSCINTGISTQVNGVPWLPLALLESLPLPRERVDMPRVGRCYSLLQHRSQHHATLWFGHKSIAVLAFLSYTGKNKTKSFFTCHSTRHLVGVPANNTHVLLRMRQFCIKCPPQAWLSNINFV